MGYLEEWADVHIEQCPKSTRFAEIKPSEKIDAVFRAADDARIQMGLFDINPICVLLALTKPGIAFSSDQLRSFPILDIFLQDRERPELVFPYPGERYPFYIYK